MIPLQQTLALIALIFVFYMLYKSKPDCTTITIFFIGLLIYYYMYVNTTTKEKFTNNKKEMCNILKNNLNNIKKINSEKCSKKFDPNSNPRNDINDATECYNFLGQEITTDIDTKAWCDLNDDDLDIIDEATQSIFKQPKIEVKDNQFDNLQTVVSDMKLSTYNTLDSYSNF